MHFLKISDGTTGFFDENWSSLAKKIKSLSMTYTPFTFNDRILRNDHGKDKNCKCELKKELCRQSCDKINGTFLFIYFKRKKMKMKTGIKRRKSKIAQQMEREGSVRERDFKFQSLSFQRMFEYIGKVILGK